MNRKLLIGIGLILMVLGSLNLFSVIENSEKKGLTDFVKYLNSQKEELGYKTFGLLEHPGKVEIKIHCTDETIGTILAGIEDFRYEKYTIERVSPNNVTVTVNFPKSTAAADDQDIEKPEAAAASKTESSAEADETKKDCPRKVKVQVQEITPKIFMEFKYFKKPIVPAKEVDVIAAADEMVSEVLVKEGDRVTRDQLLLTFDPERINRVLLKVESDLKSWRQILFKREHWKERSPRAENQAKGKIKEAETQMAEYKDLLAKLEVKSPVDGKVTFVVDKETGIGTDRVAARILDESVMRIDLSTEHGPLFKDGQKLRLYFKDVGGISFGKVEKKENSLKIIIKNDYHRLTGGMIAHFRVLFKKHENAVVIDVKEFLEDEKGTFVYIVDRKHAKKVYPTPGPVEAGNMLVLSGLSLGDEIITTGIECLEDGKRIKVVVLDPETGKLKKRKKKKPEKAVAKPPEKEKPEEAVVKPPKAEAPIDTDKGVLKLSVGFGINMIGEEVFKEVYGSSFISGTFGISYSFTSRLEMFAAASIVTKKGSFTEFEDEVTLTMFPLYVGGRYKFKAFSKLKPYIGAAFTMYNMKEKAGTVKSPNQSGSGFSLNGGAAMDISPVFELFLDLKYDLVKMAVEGVESDLNLSGLRLTLGVAYKFKL
jgi:membrane fusion protein (multidrug efflux system)